MRTVKIYIFFLLVYGISRRQREEDDDDGRAWKKKSESGWGRERENTHIFAFVRPDNYGFDFHNTLEITLQLNSNVNFTQRAMRSARMARRDEKF